MTQPTPAAILREAAKRIRELARAAYSGPWFFDDEGNLHDGGTDIAAFHKEANGKYAAVMHPGVALAVADWLEAVAKGICSGCDEPEFACCNHNNLLEALALARLVLGEKGGA